MGNVSRDVEMLESQLIDARAVATKHREEIVEAERCRDAAYELMKKHIDSVKQLQQMVRERDDLIDEFKRNEMRLEHDLKAAKRLPLYDTITVNAKVSDLQRQLEADEMRIQNLVNNATEGKKKIEELTDKLERSHKTTDVLNVIRTNYVECNADGWRYFVKIDPNWDACRIYMRRDERGKILEVGAEKV